MPPWFTPKPIELSRIVPLGIEPCAKICDTMIAGLDSLFTRFKIHATITPWTPITTGDDAGGTETTLAAGKALSARLRLVPLGNGGTRVSLTVSGTVLIIGRKEILEELVRRLDEMGVRRE